MRSLYHRSEEVGKEGQVSVGLRELKWTSCMTTVFYFQGPGRPQASASPDVYWPTNSIRSNCIVEASDVCGTSMLDALFDYAGYIIRS